MRSDEVGDGGFYAWSLKGRRAHLLLRFLHLLQAVLLLATPWLQELWGQKTFL